MRADAGAPLRLLGRCGHAPLAVEPPFLLAPSDDANVRWSRSRESDTLHVEVPIEPGGALLLAASCSRTNMAGNYADSVDLVRSALATFAETLSEERTSQRRINSLEAALDRSELGILLLDEDGALLFANVTAHALLDDGGCLRRAGRSIAARNLQDAVKLQVAIEHVCSAEGPLQEDPVVALRRKGRQRPLLVCISPAGQGERSAGDARAILRVIDPDRDAGALLEPICAHYRLSPVETRLACLIAKGETIEGAAEALKVMPQTARSYLKQIFIKTDTNRQTDLARLLLNSTVRALPVTHFRIV